MKLRNKMLLLAAIVFLGFFSSLMMGAILVKEVRVGGEIYRTIAGYKDLLEQIATLKADFNQIRAETLALILETDRGKMAQVSQNIELLTDRIDGEFRKALAVVGTERKGAALKDARQTWDEFHLTLEEELLPAAASGRREAAQELAIGIQKMRHERFLEQVSGLVSLLSREIREMEEKTAASVGRKLLFTAGISGILFLLAMATTIVITRTITRPLGRGVNFARSVAAGNLSETLEVRNRDEIGDLAGALNGMVHGLNGMVDRVNRSAAELTSISMAIFEASKQVVDTARQQSGQVEETSSSILEINSSIQQVGQGVDHLSGAAGENTSSILEMAASIEEVAQNVETLAVSVDEVSSSISEMAASIRQISGSVSVLMEASESTASSILQMDNSVRQVEQNALQSAGIVEKVRKDAEEGKSAVEATIAGMGEIRRSSQSTAETIQSLSAKGEDIGAILSVIDGVVDQINLLALNAAIIAAQAGDHGRGFAVVANEIKDLAERTGASTREIAGMIGGVQEETRRAVETLGRMEGSIATGERLSHQSGEVLRKIVEGVGETHARMSDIADATREQAKSGRLIRQAMERVSEMVEQIAGATREQERGTELIMAAAERMKNLTGHVRTSSREQNKASGAIARSTEGMSAMIQKIKLACDEQARGSEKIVQAVESFRSAAAINVEAAGKMDEAVAGLAHQTVLLEEEMKVFKVTEKKKAADHQAAS